LLRLVKSKRFSEFRRRTGRVRPDSVLKKLFRKNGPKTFQTVISNYYLLHYAREWLRQVANLNSMPGGIGVQVPGSGSSDVSAYLDESGRVCFKSAIVDALDGVEASRIRRCAICDRMFWAARLDKSCCSSGKCQKEWRAKLWRNRNQTAYKRSRIRKAEQTQRGDVTKSL
jgi:hypothetical protein